jgi:hypothetical protein
METDLQSSTNAPFEYLRHEVKPENGTGVLPTQCDPLI